MSATPIDRLERPAAGRWSINPGRTELAFVGRAFGLSKVRGHFTGISGTARGAADPSESTVEVTIDMASVDSRSARRDKHLRSAALLDVHNHPTAHFRSTAVSLEAGSEAIAGDLTIKGITRPVVLDVVYRGQTRDPLDNDRAMFSATATVDRHDWGVRWGRLFVSRRIKLEIDVELVRQ
jgi:polyisoprenoid-binding protein YceI